MAYIISVTPADEREELIARRIADPATQRREFYEYQNRRQELPLITLPIDLPIYRVANFRTRLDQLEIIRRDHLPPDHFSSGEENQTVQQQLHDVLHRTRLAIERPKLARA
jgi:hypothetical protein